MTCIFSLRYLMLFAICLQTVASFAQSKTNRKIPVHPLPGKGLWQHDFLYTGEWDYRKPVQTIYLVRKGKIAWTYDIPLHDSATGEMEELGDATMRPNGNIVFCRKTGASEVTPGKKLVWNYEAHRGTEIHSVQPLEEDHVLMIINGAPARALWINIQNNQIEKELILPTRTPSPHLQFRRVRLTEAGTILAAHMDSNKVVEYDLEGKAIWFAEVRSPWSAIRLKNGNTLITSNHGNIVEVNKEGKTVWEVTQKDLPDFKLFIPQVAVRLKNGNTLFTNWCPGGIKKPEDWPGSVQLVEITTDKKIVWALSQWADPDLGPASSIQVLDEPAIKKSKGYIKHYR